MALTAPPNQESSYSPCRAPVAPQPSLYNLSFLFVVQKVVLSRHDLCTGFMYWGVLGSWLELTAPGALAYWVGVSLGGGEAGRGDAQLFCLFSLKAKGSEQCSCEWAAVIL